MIRAREGDWKRLTAPHPRASQQPQPSPPKWHPRERDWRPLELVLHPMERDWRPLERAQRPRALDLQLLLRWVQRHPREKHLRDLKDRWLPLDRRSRPRAREWWLLVWLDWGQYPRATD